MSSIKKDVYWDKVNLRGGYYVKEIKNKDKDCNNKTTRVGIKEIAAEAGVSPTTVSNVALGKT